ncbi:transcription antiterminator, putative [Babesia ovis]|uniref:Transcription antiterminator, putative n=1 Tax=Babesia ovis TaxID=5869 RepID=A0A9W5WTZ0_BABOV|nr:transcription antiterminator, putative [Babesia ovis]
MSQVVEKEEQNITGQSWDDVVTTTCASIAQGLEKFQVKVDTPVYSSLEPHVIGENLRVDDGTHQVPTTPTKDAVASDVYYQLTQLELIALAACANKICNVIIFKQRERRTTRRPKPDELRQKHGDGHEDGRHHGKLIPFEPQLLPMHIPGHALPIDFNEPISKVNLEGFQHNRIAHQHFSKPRLSEAQQQLIIHNLEARAGSNPDNRWITPKPTDGIFSLGNIKGENPHHMASGDRTPNTAAMNNLSQMIQSLHLKKQSPIKGNDDVMNMSTQELSNFTFDDDESSSSQRGSQFTKFFSNFEQRHKEDRVMPGSQVQNAAGDTLNIGDAKNRERASQLLKQMIERKA